MDQIPQTQLESEVRTGEGLSVRRFFTVPGEHPFDAVEWELRDARIGHGDKVSFEQRDVEFPKSWSQNATNIVAQKYFRGQLGSPAREHSVQQMIGRVAGHDRRLGTRARLLRHRRRRRDVRGGADPHPAPPDGGVQLAGVVQRRLRGEPAVLGVLHPERRGHDGVDPRVEHQGGDDLPRRLGLGHQPVEDPRLDGASWPRAAPRPGRSASCAAPTPGRARSSPAARPAARRRWSCSTSTTPTSASSSGARPRRRTRPRRCATPASTCRSTARASTRSSTRTRTTRSA